MTDYDIFREQLLIKYPSYGHALWEPNPRKPDMPVQVGDVGFIRRGRFHRFFNAMLSADDPSHELGVPEYYEPLVPTLSDHIDTSFLGHNNYCSPGVTVEPDPGYHSGPGDFRQVSFQYNRVQGAAVLSLPVPARRDDTLAQADFRRWIVKHIDSCFVFAQKLGLGIEEMEEIVLVTGRDRTRSWTNVAFLGNQADAQVSFGAKVEGPDTIINFQFSPENARGAVLRHGPEGPSLPENQCVFIRGFRVARSFWKLPRRLKAAAGPSPDQGRYDCDPDTEVISMPAATKYRDPLYLVLDYIAEQASDCDMVLTHDDDLLKIGGLGLDSSKETLGPNVMVDLLQRSNTEIRKVLCDLSPTNSDPNTDATVVKVAMLSTTSQNWSRPRSQWTSHVSQNVDFGYTSKSAESHSLQVPAIRGDACNRRLAGHGNGAPSTSQDLADSTLRGAGNATEDALPALDNIRISFSKGWPWPSKFAHMVLDRLLTPVFIAGLLAVAAFLTVHIWDLKKTQDASEIYLEEIYNSGDTDPPHASDFVTATNSPILSSPKFTIWVIIIWFIWVFIKFTILEVFIQILARRYVRIVQSSLYSPHKRARPSASYSDDVDEWLNSWALEALLHLSLFLFFVSPVIYPFGTNDLVLGTAVWWVVISMMVYLWIALLRNPRTNGSYYGSLYWIWYFCGSMAYALGTGLFSSVLSRFGFSAVSNFLGLNYLNRFSEEIKKTAEETAWKQASEIDVLLSTFYTLDEASAQEEFFGAVPGFFESELVYGLEEHIADNSRIKFGEELNRFLDRTLALGSVSESVKNRRLVICLNAAHAALGFNGVSQILQDILGGRWPGIIQSAEMGHSFRRWSSNIHERLTPIVRRIVAQIVVDVRERNESWISLVKAEYGIAEHILRDYIGHDDSVLLSILMHLTRQAFHARSWTPRVLSTLSGFNIRDTSPELQHAFCALWNEIVLEAWNEEPINIPVRILREVRHAYVALHEGDAALTAFRASTHHFDPILVQPRSYRLCNVASHRHRTSCSPVIGSLIVPSPTRLSAASPPHTSLNETHHTPEGSIASQQGEEAYVIVEAPPSTDYSPDPSHTH